MTKHLEELIQGLPKEVQSLARFMESNPEVDCEDIKNLVVFLTDFGDALSPEFRELTIAAQELCGFEDEEFVPKESKVSLSERHERFMKAVNAVWRTAVRNYALKREKYLETHPGFLDE